MLKDTERLLALAYSNGALRLGEFTLSSGKKTHYYFDGRLLTLHPEGVVLVGRLFLEIAERAGVQAIGGPTLGADPIVTAVALTGRLKGVSLPAFVVRKEVKGHGTEQLIEGHLEPGSKVVVVDDVCTTGASLFHAINAVEQRDCSVVEVAVIVDRKEGGSEELRRRGYPFTALMEATPDGRRVDVAAPIQAGR